MYLRSSLNSSDPISSIRIGSLSGVQLADRSNKSLHSDFKTILWAPITLSSARNFTSQKSCSSKASASTFFAAISLDWMQGRPVRKRRLIQLQFIWKKKFVHTHCNDYLKSKTYFSFETLTMMSLNFVMHIRYKI